MFTRFARAAGLAASLLLAGPALANPFGDAAVADEATLDRATAREDLAQIAQSQQASTASNNSVNGTSTTGAIGIADQAFQNANGLTVINANTGNNVAMSASLNVNIVINSAPQP